MIAHFFRIRRKSKGNILHEFWSVFQASGWTIPTGCNGNWGPEAPLKKSSRDFTFPY